MVFSFVVEMIWVPGSPINDSFHWTFRIAPDHDLFQTPPLTALSVYFCSNLPGTLLTAIQEGEDYQIEDQRRQRVLQALERLRKQQAGARVYIPVQADVFSRQLADLPAGVSLEPGELRITFSSAEDLLSKLFELAQGISNDFERFRRIVEP